jgi:hypothetical protein
MLVSILIKIRYSTSISPSGLMSSLDPATH